ncbi:MAG TPA: outer membrane protein assembly factor BamD [Chlamydiales bacterium]|nr:outer membrane protein assembly factor BamD [Chlamydiales bacterium]
MMKIAAYLLTFILSLLPLRADEKASVQEYFGAMVTSSQNEEWKASIENAEAILSKFKDTPFAVDAWYYLGISHYHLGDYDVANRKLSQYLKESTSPKFFEEALYFKFLVAEKFRDGAKKHMIQWEKSPSILPAREDAVVIYDEVINTLPFHELAAKSLFGKAKLQTYFDEYRQAVETLNLLIRRFPKHELAVEGFLEIASIYQKQSKKQQDPNLLDSAEVNLRRFRQAFPGEGRVEEAKKILDGMKEIFAESLYEIGRFYERTHKNSAAVIYYTKLMAKFPDTKSAKASQKRLEKMKKEEEKTTSK